MRQRQRMRFRQFDDAVTCPSQRRIHAQHHLMRCRRAAHARFKRRRRHAHRAAHPVFHLLELLDADAHASIVPNEVCLQSRNKLTLAAYLCPGDSVWEEEDEDEEE